MGKRTIQPIHPGEHLAEILDELSLSQYRLAKDIGVPPRRINEIILGKRSITADTALRLARYFNTSAQYWLNLQTHYDLEVATASLGKRLEREVKSRIAA
ncbi:MAG: HigA family addiction module antidote protein [Gammaproteobacteria bacterium]|nr:HigA family addiction module antidote protein [Gammaproteobacteria bacterium]